MIRNLHLPVYGMNAHVAVEPAAFDETRDDLFGALVGLYRESKQLAEAFEQLCNRRRSAVAYLETPGCNPVLACARLSLLDAQRSTLTARIRANRAATLAFLGRLGRTAA